MRLLYVLLSYGLLAVLLPVLMFHRKTRDGLMERLGFYPPGRFSASRSSCPPSPTPAG